MCRPKKKATKKFRKNLGAQIWNQSQNSIKKNPGAHPGPEAIVLAKE